MIKNLIMCNKFTFRTMIFFYPKKRCTIKKMEKQLHIPTLIYTFTYIRIKLALTKFSGEQKINVGPTLTLHVCRSECINPEIVEDSDPDTDINMIDAPVIQSLNLAVPW